MPEQPTQWRSRAGVRRGEHLDAPPKPSGISAERGGEIEQTSPPKGDPKDIFAVKSKSLPKRDPTNIFVVESNRHLRQREIQQTSSPKNGTTRSERPCQAAQGTCGKSFVQLTKGERGIFGR